MQTTGDGADGLVQLEGKKGPKCHTAMPGERCYKDVSWAITDGIYAHPEWYEGLTNESNFETFQAVVYKINSTRCPLPCNYDPHKGLPHKEHSTEKGGGKGHKAHGHAPKHEFKHGKGKIHHKHVKAKASEAPELSKKDKESEDAVDKKQQEKDSQATHACHTATGDDHCAKAVRWAMTDGIKEKPEWYKGLSKTSSFEAFQAHLHETPESNCPRPCECHTALEGEKCHEHVLWVLKEGILEHPDWYEGVKSTSAFEDVQRRLHEDTNTSCSMPCTPRVFGSPSLFCFSVFQSTGYEHGLMKAQLKKREGIFSCDEFAVVADGPVSLGMGPFGEVKSLVIPHTTVGISKDNTAANTLIFIHAWQAIYNDFQFRKHDWTLKVDPDAVIVPKRLRVHLAPHTGKKVYIKNCNKYPGSPNWPMMFGSLEAISQSAMWAYMQGSDRCKSELEWEAWGEDLYLAECLDLLGCDNVHDYKIISDKVCLGVDCTDDWAAAFHAFKSTASWMKCWGQVFDTDAAQ